MINIAERDRMRANVIHQSQQIVTVFDRLPDPTHERITRLVFWLILPCASDRNVLPKSSDVAEKSQALRKPNRFARELVVVVAKLKDAALLAVVGAVFEDDILVRRVVNILFRIVFVGVSFKQCSAP